MGLCIDTGIFVVRRMNSFSGSFAVMQTKVLRSIVLRRSLNLPPQIKMLQVLNFSRVIFFYHHGLLELFQALPAFDGNQEQYSPPMSRMSNTPCPPLFISPPCSTALPMAGWRACPCLPPTSTGFSYFDRRDCCRREPKIDGFYPEFRFHSRISEAECLDPSHVGVSFPIAPGGRPRKGRPVRGGSGRGRETGAER